MKNRFKKAASVLLTLTLALGVAVIAPLTAAAAQTASDSTAAGITVLDITAQDIRSAKEQELKEIPDAAMRKGDGKAIQDALDLAHERATDANPYLVRVQAGSYDMVSSLIIYSNTTLSLYGVTLNHRADADHPSFNLLRIGDFDVLEEGTNIYKTGAVGYCHRNITVEGGIFDGCMDCNTMMKLTHAKNVMLNNVEIRNDHNAHMIETAGVDGLIVRNCTFRDQIMDEGTGIGYEALQIDILKLYNIYDARSEDLPMKNVLVENCRFSNCPRGVGSHTSVHNAPHSNIVIRDNVFENMGSAAIQTLGWTNSKIVRNTIYRAPRGIAVYSIKDGGKGTVLPSILAKEGTTQAHTTDEYRELKSNLLIDSNTITGCGVISDVYAPSYPKAGISIIGGTSNGTYIPKGDYYCDGITVTNNRIESTGMAVRVQFAKNIDIDRNVISHLGQSDTKDYGISCIRKMSGINIRNNYIANTPKEGIRVEENCSANEISGNTVVNSGVSAIRLINDASAVSVNNNELLSGRMNGISVNQNSKISVSASGNRVVNAAATGVYVEKNSVVMGLTQNLFSGCKTAVDFRGTGIQADNVTNNQTPQAVSFTENEVTLAVGDAYRSALTPDAAYAFDTYAYTSADQSVATVDRTTGRITACGEGVTTVTASGYSGRTAKLRITVGNPRQQALLGDVDNNRMVNATDTALIAGYVSRMRDSETKINKALADVNGDGRVNAKDRMILARCVDRIKGFDSLPTDVTGTAEAGGAISFGSTEAAAGSTVRMDVMLDTNPGVASVDLDLEYDDSVLTLVRVEETGLLKNATAEHSDKLCAPYHLSWVNDTAMKNDTATGKLATLIFEVNSTAKKGACSVSCNGDSQEVYDRYVRQVPFGFTAGSVTVTKETHTVDVTVSNTAAAIQETKVELVPAGETEAAYTAVYTDGVHRLEKVSEGDYLLRVTGEGNVPFEKALSVTADVSEQATLQRLGDVNGDNAVDEADYTLLTDVTAGLSDTEINTAAADVTADGAVNSLDRIALFRYLAGEIKALPYTEATVAEGSGKAAVNAVQTCKNGTAEITFSVTENPGIAAMAFDVVYDHAAMTFEGADDGGLVKSAEMKCAATDSSCRLTWINDMRGEDSTANGVLVTLRFRVSDKTAQGSYSVGVDAGSVIFCNSDLALVPFTFTGGGVEVIEAEAAVSGIVSGGDREALVELIPAGQTEAAAAAVTEDGAYRLPAVSSGAYLLRVTKDGCVTEERIIHILSDNLTVDVKLRIRGDANGDGTVDIHDVTAIQRQLAEYGEVNDPAAADMDGDGTVTISDVTAIQRMLAEFPI